MTSFLRDPVTVAIAGCGAFMGFLAYAIGDLPALWAAMIAVCVCVGNWGLIRWSAQRLFERNHGSKTGAIVVIIVKLTGILALCWVLLVKVGLDPLGFALGMGALAGGVLIGAPRLAGSLSYPINKE